VEIGFSCSVCDVGTCFSNEIDGGCVLLFLVGLGDAIFRSPFFSSELCATFFFTGLFIAIGDTVGRGMRVRGDGGHEILTLYGPSSLWLILRQGP